MTKKILTIIVIITAFSVYLIAHRPSGMELNFDNETKVLEVVVSHSVGNPANHYIDTITVSHGDRQMILHELTKQETSSEIVFKYRIPEAESGMELSVMAKCNRVGSLTQKIKID